MHTYIHTYIAVLTFEIVATSCWKKLWPSIFWKSLNWEDLVRRVVYIRSQSTSVRSLSNCWTLCPAATSYPCVTIHSFPHHYWVIMYGDLIVLAATVTQASLLRKQLLSHWTVSLASTFWLHHQEEDQKLLPKEISSSTEQESENMPSWMEASWSHPRM